VFSAPLAFFLLCRGLLKQMAKASGHYTVAVKAAMNAVAEAMFAS